MIYIKIFNLIYLFSIIRLVFGYNCWYSASSNAGVKKHNPNNASISTATQALDLGDFHLELILGDPTELALTDCEGDRFVKVGGYLKLVSSGTKEAVMTVTPKFYKYILTSDTVAQSGKVYCTQGGSAPNLTYTLFETEVGTTTVTGKYEKQEASANDLKGVNGGTYSFTITATGRTRIANGQVTTFKSGAPADNDEYGYGLTIKGQVVLAADGTYTIATLATGTAAGSAQSADSSIKVTYSVGGEATDANRSDNDAYSADADSSAVTGGFSISFD